MALKKARRPHVSESLNITSMMDMFTIILVFLLKSYSAEDISVAASEDLQLPSSTSLKDPETAVNVVVSKKEVIVDGVKVLDLTLIPDEENPGQQIIAVPEDEKRGQMITRLFDRLSEKASAAKAIGEATGSDEMGFKGRVLLQCDKTLPFSVIREVMYTAGQAQFGEFKFVVYKTGE